MVQQNKHLFYFYIDIIAGYNICDNHFNLIKTVKQEKSFKDILGFPIFTALFWNLYSYFLIIQFSTIQSNKSIEVKKNWNIQYFCAHNHM